MSADKVNITSGGIQRVLRNYNEKQALAEYIWNGFDANAGTIEMSYNKNQLGYIDQLIVTDNGHGINFEALKVKFDPFYESEKALQLAVNRHRSVMHGKNGVGRLTFFRLANDAEWQTTFLHGSQLRSGTIRIGVASLNNYQATKLAEPLMEKPGTKVIFSNLKVSADQLEQEIIPFLKSEFCWFLELNKNRNYRILINDEPLDYSDQIQDYEENIILRHEQTSFKLKFVQWKESLHKELSKVYFINEKGEELHKEYTTLNKKADEYFHSVYIESEFFTDFDFSNAESELQVGLFQRSKSSPEYKFLNKQVNELLRAKRKVYLKGYSSRLIERYEKEGVLALVTGDHIDPKRKRDLLEVLKALYEIQPKLFSNLSIDQKKTITALLDALLISDQRPRIVNTLSSIVDMEDGERDELNEIIYY